MEKPKRAFRVDRVWTHMGYGESYYKWTFHFGRIQLTGKGFAALVGLIAVLLVGSQIILGVMSGWTNFTPLVVLASAFLLYLVGLILVGVVQFFRWLGRQFTVNGPGGNS